MGLFGAFGKAGTKAVAKQLDDNRTAKIISMEQSGIIKFADNAAISNGVNLPFTYFGNPVDAKEKEIMYEMVGKLLKTAEFQQIAAQGQTYFIIAGSITGKATNGVLVHESGIFDGGFTSKFIPRDKMTEIGTDKKGWIYIKDSSGMTNYLVGADNKKIKAESQTYIQMLKQIYGL